MNNNNQNGLEQWGWNTAWQETWQRGGWGGEPARVVEVQRGRWRVAGQHAEAWVGVRGRLFKDGDVTQASPVVGDMVCVVPAVADGACIEDVLPRQGVIQRKAAGTATVPQVLGANVDVAFLMTGADGDFNPRRVARYAGAIGGGQVKTVVVLTKVDLVEDVERKLDALREAVPGSAVVGVSARTGQGVDQLSPWLMPGTTVAMVGMSGTGKSSLLNRLLDEELQPTSPVRSWDARGRHTTTHRQLFPLPGGALLLDAPGMREFHAWLDPDHPTASPFEDVETLAQACRYGDCSHSGEPGCAVQEALEQGDLPQHRVDAWASHQRETAYVLAQTDARAKEGRKRKEKELGRLQHAMKKQRTRDR